MLIRLIISISLIGIANFITVGNSTVQTDNIYKPINQKSVFIPNEGQWDDEVLFLTKTEGLNAWITDTGIMLDFYRIEKSDDIFKNSSRDRIRAMLYEPEKLHRYGHVVRMNFLNIQEIKPKYRMLEQRTTNYNFFIGNDNERWARNISLYGEVIIENIYQDIDVRYYYNSEGLRYDLILHPGAIVENIIFTMEGADDVWLNEDGELVILTSIGEVKHKDLMAYQELNGEDIEIPVEFTIDDKSNIGYAVEAKDKNKPIIIDPLISSTYLGSSRVGVGSSLVVNSGNRVYVTGFTNSDDFPTTPGAYNNETYDNTWNVFISSLSLDLEELYYSAIIGGSSEDRGYSIAICSQGNIYVVGFTKSLNFPTTSGVYDETLNSDQDVFISVFSPDLSELLYSTYLGGNSIEWCYDLTLDADDNVYITGSTESIDFPSTANVYSETFNGIKDVFVSILNYDLSELLYSTFLGGSGDDSIIREGEVSHSIALNSENNIYITGYTVSKDFPTTTGAYDEVHNIGADVFISSFNSDLSELLYSTYLGGNFGEWGISLALDVEDNVYVAGDTYSDNFPTTQGAYDELYNGDSDIFISVLNNELSDLLYSTYFGGSGGELEFGDWVHHMSLDLNGNVYLTGTTGSDDFPITSHAYDTIFNRAYDSFISILSPDLSDIVYSTYLGGSGWDMGNWITLDTDNNVYVTGYTGSEDFPTTTGAYDEVHNNSFDVFISKFKSTIVSVSDKYSDGFPSMYTIYQNYPNPFNPSTNIEITLPEAKHITLNIYDMLGRHVATLVDGYKEAGVHSVKFKAHDLSSGVYFYRIEVEGYVESKKMLYLK